MGSIYSMAGPRSFMKKNDRGPAKAFFSGKSPISKYVLQNNQYSGYDYGCLQIFCCLTRMFTRGPRTW